MSIQGPLCKLAVLVPIYNEDPFIVERLLSSLEAQQHIDPAEFEVLCLVNNDLPGTTGHDNAFEANQRVLAMLRNRQHRANVVTLDCSSAGCETSANNIGKVRDRLVRTAYERFSAREYNGVLFHVDADVYLDDPLFLRKALNGFADPEVIGIAGGKWREAFLDEYPEYDAEQLRKGFEAIGFAKQCKELSNFVKGKPVLHAFGGSNMFSRCYESVEVGSVPHHAVGEDKQFGYRLAAYAQTRGKKILVQKVEMKVVAAFRISDRTASSFREEIECAMAGEQLSVKHPYGYEDLLVNHETFEYLRREALKLPYGEELVRYIEDYGVLWIRERAPQRVTATLQVAA